MEQQTLCDDSWYPLNLSCHQPGTDPSRINWHQRALFGKSTASIERTHLTMRLFNGRCVRYTLGFFKDVDRYRASAAWKDARYNLVRPLKTLRLAIQDVAGCCLSPMHADDVQHHGHTGDRLGHSFDVQV